MSEMKEFIVDSAEKICKDLSTKDVREAFEEGNWPRQLYETMEESGLMLLGIDEEQGGVGGDFEDVLGVLYVAGKYAVPLPLLELTLANYTLAQLGLNLDGKKSIVKVVESGEDVTLKQVPFARNVDQVILLKSSDDQLYYLTVDCKDVQLKTQENVAGEPRDTLTLTGTEEWKLSTLAATAYLEKVKQWEAAGKVALMVGAIESILNLSVFYSKERVQFGRPIYKFQAVQQHITSMAGEYAAAYSTLQVLLSAVDQPHFKRYVAMAKTTISQQSNVVAKAAHQLHAGIGMTYEHELHHFTRRLWAWREEAGNESYWTEKMAKWILEDPSSIWEQITLVEGGRQNAGSAL